MYVKYMYPLIIINLCINGRYIKLILKLLKFCLKGATSCIYILITIIN